MNLLDLVWSNNTAQGRTIIVLVVVLGVFGSLCAIAHRRRYLHVEAKWLERVRQKLRLARDARQIASAEEQPPAAASPIIDLNELADGIPQSSIVGDRLHTIIRMKQARVKVNVDALQQCSILKESSKWTLAFPAYVVSLGMMLGLLR